MRAWLTPDAGTIDTLCIQVIIPDDDTMRRAFYGALLALEQVWNWEQFGTMTPEDAAAIWAECNEQSIPITEC